jgi:hypothetical protein
MLNSKLVILLLALWFLAFPRPVHAYIDPGTGSYFIQLLVGGLLALLYTLKIYWARIRSFFSTKIGNSRKP